MLEAVTEFAATLVNPLAGAAVMALAFALARPGRPTVSAVDTRIAAYAVVVEDRGMLLAHWNEAGRAAWTLPGGGIDPGEDPADAVVDFYRSSLTAAGFAESPAPGGTGVLAATFTRGGGAEVLTVAVTADGDERGFTVGGSVAAP